MALSNRDRLGKALDQLRDALLPYISRQLYDNLGSNWQDRLDPKANNLHDVALLINLFIEHWQVVFRKTLSQSDRAYVSELKEARNKWAHSAPMASDDVDRYLDTAVRLCRNINASEQADAIRAIREELQQLATEVSRSVGAAEGADELSYAQFVELLGLAAFVLAAAQGNSGAPMLLKLQLMLLALEASGGAFRGGEAAAAMLRAAAEAARAAAR